MKQENENSSLFLCRHQSIKSIFSHILLISCNLKVHSNEISESRPLRRVVSILKFFTGDAELKPSRKNRTFSFLRASRIFLSYSNIYNPSSPRGFETAAICRNKEKLIKINDSCNLNEAHFMIKSPADALAVYVHVFLFGNLGSAGRHRGAKR